MSAPSRPVPADGTQVVRVHAFGATDVGRRRGHNEDSFCVSPGARLLIVADGMGGHAAGEVASRITVDTMCEFLGSEANDRTDDTWPDLRAKGEDVRTQAERLIAAIARANERVLEAVRAEPRLKGMGTTVVAALFDDGVVSFGHVGDSRAYLVREGRLRRLTDDHSWVHEQIAAGLITEEEARHHPLKNVVTRALGGGATVVPDVIHVPLVDGDRYVLCSDGLTAVVEDHEILDSAEANESPDGLTRKLVDLANERGGPDNITVVVADISVVDPAPEAAG
jgi:PPM family protein phosphatase